MRTKPERVGLLGGSFDPVHNGHVRLARAARRQLKLTRVYFVVAARSPFKMRARALPVAQRARLIRLATRNDSVYRVGLWETKRPAPSYTVDTLLRYRKTHPDHELFFLLGSDALSRFEKWHRAREILSLCTLAVARRPGSSPVRRPFGRAVVVLKGRFPRVSSTSLREEAAEGKSLAGRVPVSVAREIRRRGFYREAA